MAAVGESLTGYDEDSMNDGGNGGNPPRVCPFFFFFFFFSSSFSFSFFFFLS